MHTRDLRTGQLDRRIFPVRFSYQGLPFSASEGAAPRRCLMWELTAMNASAKCRLRNVTWGFRPMGVLSPGRLSESPD